MAAVAHRTSPTNMGLALLANLSAYDFGYIRRTAHRTHGEAPIRWQPWIDTAGTSTTGTTRSL